MLTLYLRNKGRTVLIDIGDIHLKYLGSKALVKFVKIKRVHDGMIHVDTMFLYEGSYITEEDYIDLVDILNEYNYNTEEIISLIGEYKIA